MKASTLPTLLTALGRAESSGSPDAVLLELFVNNGDQSAFTQLVHRYARLVWRVARTRCRSEATAEDVFQATFVVLAKKAGSIRTAGALAGWLHRTAHRLAVKATRAEAKAKPDRPRPRQLNPLDDLSARELLAIVDDELAKLTDAERTVVLLCGVDGEPLDDVAMRLGYSSTVVKGRLQRARAKLRTRLELRGLTLPAVLVGLFAAPTLSTIQAAIHAATTNTYTLAISTLIAEGLIMKATLLKATVALTLCGLLAIVGGGGGTPNASSSATAAPLPKADAPDGMLLVGKLDYSGKTKILEVFDPAGKDGQFLDVGALRNIYKTSVSPDGKRLAFTNVAPFSLQNPIPFSYEEHLYLVDLPITAPPKEPLLKGLYDPTFAWTPDSKSFYVSRVPASADVVMQRMEKKMVPKETLKIDAVTLKEELIKLPEWHSVQDVSKDGQLLLTRTKYYGNAGEVFHNTFVVPVKTLEPRQIGEIEKGFETANFSPDGKQILGMRRHWDKKKDYGVFLVDVMTEESTAIPLPKEIKPAMVDGATWSPDGKRIAVLWNERDAKAKQNQPAAGGGGDRNLSSVINQRVTVMDVTGKNASTVREFEEGVYHYHIEWANPKLGEMNPDARKINSPLPKEKADPGVVWIYNWQTGKLLAYRPNGDKLKEYAFPKADGNRFKGLTPDGTKFVFVQGKENTLHTRPVGDETEATDLGVKMIDGYWHAWSPDGKRLLVAYGENDNGDAVTICGIYTSDGKKEHAFKLKELSPYSWADNKSLLLVTNQAQGLHPQFVKVVKTSVEGGETETIFNGEYLDLPMLSPDGTKLLGFDNFRPGPDDKPNRGVQIYDLKTKKTEDVDRREKQGYAGGLWSPDGKRIGYRWCDVKPTKEDRLAGDWHFVVSDVDGKNEVTLMTEGMSNTVQSTQIYGWTPTPPALKDAKPEARKINAPLPKEKPPEGVIVLSSFSEKKKIELFKPDGESFKVFEPKGNVINARLAPDGKRVVFYDFTPMAGAGNGSWSVFDFCWFDAEDGGLDVQKIAAGVSGGVSNAWSIDGQTVYFSQLDPEKFDDSAKPGEHMQYRSHSFNFKTKKSTALKLPAEQIILDIAPDGKSLLTSSHRNGASTRSLFLTPLDTCKPQLLMKDETGSTYTRFSPDGKQLLLSRAGPVAKADKDSGPGVYHLDLTTKKESKIRLPDEMKDSESFNACFSPDGKRIAIHWYADIPQPRGAPIPAGPLPAGKARWLASRVTVCDIDGGNAKTVISKEYNESITGIDWAPVRLPEEKEQVDRNISAPLPKENQSEWKERDPIEFKDGGRVTSIAIAASGKTFAVCREDGRIDFYDPLTRKHKQSMHRKDPKVDWDKEVGVVSSIAFRTRPHNKLGDVFAVTHKDGLIVGTTDLGLQVNDAPRVDDIPANWIQKDFDPRQVLWVGDGLVATNGEETRHRDANGKESTYKGFAWNRKMPVVLAGVPGINSWLMHFNNNNKDDEVGMWWWNPDNIKDCQRSSGHIYAQKQAAVSGDGKVIVSTDGPGSLLLWDAATMKKTAQVDFPEKSGAAAVAITPDGKTVAVVLEKPTYLKQAVPGGKPDTTPENWQTELEVRVYSIAELIAAGKTAPMPRFTWKSDKPLTGFSRHQPVLEFSADGKTLLAAFGDPYTTDKDAKSLGVKVWTLADADARKINAPLPKEKDEGLIWTHEHTTNTLKAYTPAGKESKQIKLPKEMPLIGLTPGGTQLMFAGYKGKVRVLTEEQQRSTGLIPALTLHLGSIDDSGTGTDTGLDQQLGDSFVMSPDGTQVVRVRPLGKGPNTGMYNHVLYDIAKKEETNLGFAQRNQVRQWSVDGKFWNVIQYNLTAEDLSLPQYRLLQSPITGKESVPVCDKVSLMTFDQSADGMAFVGVGQLVEQRGGDFPLGLYVVQDGKAELHAKLEGAFSGTPKWSFDGTRVALMQLERDTVGKNNRAISSSTLYVVDAEGKKTKLYSKPVEDGMPTLLGWFPTATRMKINAPLPKEKLDTKGLEASLKMEKNKFLLGEPVFMTFTVENPTETAWQFAEGGDYRNKLGRPNSFSVTVKDAEGKEVPKPDSGFDMGGMSQMKKLLPDSKAAFQPLFLPHWATFSKPGEYTVTVSRNVGLVPADAIEPLHAKAIHVSLSSTEKVTVLPADSKKMGELIDTWGLALLNPKASTTDASVKKLLAIQDDRAISYFVTLSQRAHSSYKQTACEGLKKYSTNDAFVALKAMSLTKGDDLVDNGGTKEQMESSARSVRHYAISALTDCGHNDAVAEVWKAQDDESYAVRMTVLHKAYAVKSDESRQIIDKMTKDTNEQVKTEAKRYAGLLAKERTK
jgi:RNA polymerase sigma factor (sigma-70 family)